jgi:hypothetical protein
MRRDGRKREKKRADLRKENNPPAITNRKNDTPTNPPVQATKRTTKHLVLFSHSLSQRGKPVKGGMENGTAKEGRRSIPHYQRKNGGREAWRKESKTIIYTTNPAFFFSKVLRSF